MALSEADRQRARQIAEAAPPLTPEQKARLRALLSGVTPPARTATTTDDRDGADAA